MLEKRAADSGASARLVQAVWHGAVIATSDRTIRLEGNHYFPAGDVDRRYLERSEHHTTCPWKGQASYYDVIVEGARNSAAAWYYPHPSPAAAQIAGHVAFWHGIEVKPAPASEPPSAHGGTGR